MAIVKAKKHLGQHFLTDSGIAAKIVDALQLTTAYSTVLEVGPGMGILTQHLLAHTAYTTWVVDIDTESVAYLQTTFPALQGRIISADFLQLNLPQLFPGPLAIIGNFPYNISSQILFKIIDNRQQVTECVGMFQKEVARRVAAPPGSKDYGILSVFLQAYYHITYLFTVKPGTFNPPPKVHSGVIRLQRNSTHALACDEKLFFRTVKQAFNQRRKTLRNALGGLVPKDQLSRGPYLELRAEQLSVADFVILTNFLASCPALTKSS